MTDAELRVLLQDCVVLWNVDARAVASPEGIEVIAGNAALLVQRAPADMRPVRWLLHSPDRVASGRPPRALPSIVALLAALRNALGADGGNRLRIGGSAA